MAFERSEWIWNSADWGEDEYAEFRDEFTWEGGKVAARVSVSGDYTLWINGRVASSSQYGDFPSHKAYNEVDVTPYLQPGKNVLALLAWYTNAVGFRCMTPTPGVIWEIVGADGAPLSVSRPAVPSRLSRTYQSHRKKEITEQIGYGFRFDATADDGWTAAPAEGFSPSAALPRTTVFEPRPIAEHRMEPLRAGTVTRTGKSLLFDLGDEVVGYLSFSFRSACEQDLLISWGEVLKDGHVKRIIGPRDFSVEYRAKAGENVFSNRMLRVAARYIEVECPVEPEAPVFGILPLVYPVRERKVDLPDPLDRDIYRICVNTLRLCMMERYVDCPWREQSLYAFDSRNQMLAGYDAFEGGNLAYVAANLRLISRDRREDRFLSMCFPSAHDLVIPSFSLYYFLSVREYLAHGGDPALGAEVLPVLERVVGVFLENRENGLINKFSGAEHWNFYDWTPFAKGTCHHSETPCPDLFINCIFLLAMEAFDAICAAVGAENRYRADVNAIRKATRERFFDPGTGLFAVLGPGEEPTELGNALAVLCGVAEGETAEKIAAALAAGTLQSCTLAMKCFKYDAMLRVNEEKYREAVLAEIRATYRRMLEAGSTTVWETIDGAAAFRDAGSLCHGWSAIPVCYYRRFFPQAWKT